MLRGIVKNHKNSGLSRYAEMRREEKSRVGGVFYIREGCCWQGVNYVFIYVLRRMYAGW